MARTEAPEDKLVTDDVIINTYTPLQDEQKCKSRDNRCLEVSEPCFTLSIYIYPKCINSLTTKSRRQNFRLQIFKKMLSPSYIIMRIQGLEGNSVDLD